MRYVRCLLVLIGVATASAAYSDRATLTLDGLSFFHFKGADVGAGLPAGVQIPLTVIQNGTAQWVVTISPEDFSLPPTIYPSGRTVVWHLSSTAVGEITRIGSEALVTLSVPLVATVLGGTREPSPFPLTFTTEDAVQRAGGEVAQREGVRLQLASGYAQLVSVGVSPLGAPTAPGKPFYAVLSGTIAPLPAGLGALE